MDIERSLVSRIAETLDFAPALARDLEEIHFLQRPKGDTSPMPLPGEVYGWMLAHFRRYKSCPSMALVHNRYPNFEFIADPNPVDVLVNTMVAEVKRRGLIQGIRDLSIVADDPTKWEDAEIHTFAIAADLARTLPGSNVTRLSDAPNRLELHRKMQETGRAPGVTLVAPDLDALTFGIQPGELLIWQGFLGGGKSTMTMIQSAREYLDKSSTSLVLSLEMEGQKMANRWDAAMAGFHYRALKFMEMKEEDYDRWARFAEAAYEARFERDVLVIDDIHRCTPERIFSEVEKWKPDFFIVDTVDEIVAPSYLRSNWEKIDHSARELKAVCRVTRTPGIGVAQAGREAEEEGARLGNMAGSITIARKADLVVGLHANDQMKRSKMLELRMLKNRDGEGDGLSYTYFRDPATLTLRAWTPADNVNLPPSTANSPAAAMLSEPAGARSDSEPASPPVEKVPGPPIPPYYPAPPAP